MLYEAEFRARWSFPDSSNGDGDTSGLNFKNMNFNDRIIKIEALKEMQLDSATYKRYLI